MSNANIDSDDARYQYNHGKFIDKYFDLFENLNFPPMFIAGQDLVAGEYEMALKEAYVDGLSVPRIDFITGDAKPFSEFESKFKKEIDEARKFRNATNDNHRLALDLYAKENGELHESEYIKQQKRP